MKIAREEVTKTFNCGNDVRAVFVVRPETGRLTTLNVIVIGTVLSSLESAGYKMKGKYGLIINQLSKNVYREFQ